MEPTRSRLHLRPFRAEDWDAFFDDFNDAEIWRMLGCRLVNESQTGLRERQEALARPLAAR